MPKWKHICINRMEDLDKVTKHELYVAEMRCPKCKRISHHIYNPQNSSATYMMNYCSFCGERMVEEDE